MFARTTCAALSRVPLRPPARFLSNHSAAPSTSVSAPVRQTTHIPINTTTTPSPLPTPIVTLRTHTFFRHYAPASAAAVSGALLGVSHAVAAPIRGNPTDGLETLKTVDPLTSRLIEEAPHFAPPSGHQLTNDDLDDVNFMMKLVSEGVSPEKIDEEVQRRTYAKLRADLKAKGKDVPLELQSPEERKSANLKKAQDLIDDLNNVMTPVEESALFPGQTRAKYYDFLKQTRDEIAEEMKTMDTTPIDVSTLDQELLLEIDNWVTEKPYSSQYPEHFQDTPELLVVLESKRLRKIQLRERQSAVQAYQNELQKLIHSGIFEANELQLFLKHKTWEDIVFPSNNPWEIPDLCTKKEFEAITAKPYWAITPIEAQTIDTARHYLQKWISILINEPTLLDTVEEHQLDKEIHAQAEYEVTHINQLFTPQNVENKTAVNQSVFNTFLETLKNVVVPDKDEISQRKFASYTLSTHLTERIQREYTTFDRIKQQLTELHNIKLPLNAPNEVRLHYQQKYELLLSRLSMQKRNLSREIERYKKHTRSEEKRQKLLHLPSSNTTEYENALTEISSMIEKTQLTHKQQQPPKPINMNQTDLLTPKPHLFYPDIKDSLHNDDVYHNNTELIGNSDPFTPLKFDPQNPRGFLRQIISEHIKIKTKIANENEKRANFNENNQNGLESSIPFEVTLDSGFFNSSDARDSQNGTNSSDVRSTEYTIPTTNIRVERVYNPEIDQYQYYVKTAEQKAALEQWTSTLSKKRERLNELRSFQRAREFTKERERIRLEIEHFKGEQELENDLYKAEVISQLRDRGADEDYIRIVQRDLDTLTTPIPPELQALYKRYQEVDAFMKHLQDIVDPTAVALQEQEIFELEKLFEPRSKRKYIEYMKLLAKGSEEYTPREAALLQKYISLFNKNIQENQIAAETLFPSDMPNSLSFYHENGELIDIKMSPHTYFPDVHETDYEQTNNHDDKYDEDGNIIIPEPISEEERENLDKARGPNFIPTLITVPTPPDSHFIWPHVLEELIFFLTQDNDYEHITPPWNPMKNLTGHNHLVGREEFEMYARTGPAHPDSPQPLPILPITKEMTPIPRPLGQNTAMTMFGLVHFGPFSYSLPQDPIDGIDGHTHYLRNLIRDYTFTAKNSENDNSSQKGLVPDDKSHSDPDNPYTRWVREHFNEQSSIDIFTRLTRRKEAETKQKEEKNEVLLLDSLIDSLYSESNVQSENISGFDQVSDASEALMQQFNSFNSPSTQQKIDQVKFEELKRTIKDSPDSSTIDPSTPTFFPPASPLSDRLHSEKNDLSRFKNRENEFSRDARTPIDFSNPDDLADRAFVLKNSLSIEYHAKRDRLNELIAQKQHFIDSGMKFDDSEISTAIAELSTDLEGYTFKRQIVGVDEGMIMSVLNQFNQATVAADNKFGHTRSTQFKMLTYSLLQPTDFYYVVTNMEYLEEAPKIALLPLAKAQKTSSQLDEFTSTQSTQMDFDMNMDEFTQFDAESQRILDEKWEQSPNDDKVISKHQIKEMKRDKGIYKLGSLDKPIFPVSTPNSIPETPKVDPNSFHAYMTKHMDEFEEKRSKLPYTTDDISFEELSSIIDIDTTSPTAGPSNLRTNVDEIADSVRQEFHLFNDFYTSYVLERRDLLEKQLKEQYLLNKRRTMEQNDLNKPWAQVKSYLFARSLDIPVAEMITTYVLDEPFHKLNDFTQDRINSLTLPTLVSFYQAKRSNQYAAEHLHPYYHKALKETFVRMKVKQLEEEEKVKIYEFNKNKMYAAFHEYKRAIWPRLPQDDLDGVIDKDVLLKNLIKENVVKPLEVIFGDGTKFTNPLFNPNNIDKMIDTVVHENGTFDARNPLRLTEDQIKFKRELIQEKDAFLQKVKKLKLSQYRDQQASTYYQHLDALGNPIRKTTGFDLPITITKKEQMYEMLRKIGHDDLSNETVKKSKKSHSDSDDENINDTDLEDYIIDINDVDTAFPMFMTDEEILQESQIIQRYKLKQAVVDNELDFLPPTERAMPKFKYSHLPPHERVVRDIEDISDEYTYRILTTPEKKLWNAGERELRKNLLQNERLTLSYRRVMDHYDAYTLNRYKDYIHYRDELKLKQSLVQTKRQKLLKQRAILLEKQQSTEEVDAALQELFNEYQNLFKNKDYVVKRDGILIRVDQIEEQIKFLKRIDDIGRKQDELTLKYKTGELFPRQEISSKPVVTPSPTPQESQQQSGGWFGWLFGSTSNTAEQFPTEKKKKSKKQRKIEKESEKAAEEAKQKEEDGRIQREEAEFRAMFSSIEFEEYRERYVFAFSYDDVFNQDYFRNCEKLSPKSYNPADYSQLWPFDDGLFFIREFEEYDWLMRYADRIPAMHKDHMELNQGTFRKKPQYKIASTAPLELDLPSSYLPPIPITPYSKVKKDKIDLKEFKRKRYQHLKQLHRGVQKLVNEKTKADPSRILSYVTDLSDEDREDIASWKYQGLTDKQIQHRLAVKKYRMYAQEVLQEHLEYSVDHQMNGLPLSEYGKLNTFLMRQYTRDKEDEIQRDIMGGKVNLLSSKLSPYGI